MKKNILIISVLVFIGAGYAAGVPFVKNPIDSVIYKTEKVSNEVDEKYLNENGCGVQLKNSIESDVCPVKPPVEE